MLHKKSRPSQTTANERLITRKKFSEATVFDKTMRRPIYAQITLNHKFFLENMSLFASAAKVYILWSWCIISKNRTLIFIVLSQGFSNLFIHGTRCLIIFAHGTLRQKNFEAQICQEY